MTATMEYNYLGSSGLKVSNICLGTLTFGTTDKGFTQFFQSSRQVDEASSHKLMDRFVELGGNFIDTANLYSFGNAEEIIGKWLQKQQREKIVIATKVRYPIDVTNPNYAGLSRRHLIESCEDSLKRLQTDFIDLYQAHAWDNATPMEETLRTFDDLVRCGKIRYFGFSNVCGWQLQKIADVTKEFGLNNCISLQEDPIKLKTYGDDKVRNRYFQQPRGQNFMTDRLTSPVFELILAFIPDLHQEYNLLERFNEYEAFMVCQNQGIGVLPYSPLKGGRLTGKFKRTEVPDEKGSRIGLLNKYGSHGSGFPQWSEVCNNETYWNLVNEMAIIAKNQGKSVPQVAIRWLLQKDIVSSVIIGVSSMTQLKHNIGAATGWKLTDEEMAKLDELSRPKLPSSYVQIWGVISGDRYNRFNNQSIKLYNTDSNLEKKQSVDL